MFDVINTQLLENLKKEAKAWNQREYENMVNRVEKTMPEVQEFVEK